MRARVFLESLRSRMLLRFGEQGSKRLVAISLACLAVVILAVVAFLLLNIKTIEVTGDVTMFNEGEVIAAAGIEEGDRLLGVSAGRIKRNIQKNMPIAQNIKVRKSLFGKITINIELLKVDYYFKHGEKYFALDADLLVLDSNKEYTKYSAYGAVRVDLPEVREPVIGERIVFYDTVEETDTEGETLYEVREESFYDFTRKFLCELKSSGYHLEANAVILNEKFEITLIYANKFRINFGDSLDLDVKFRVLYEMLAEGSMQYAEKVSIDLSDPSRATARADMTLDFSEYVD
jgi:hypothetical protein